MRPFGGGGCRPDGEGPRDDLLNRLSSSAYLDEEIQHHILERAEVLVQAGWDEDAALEEATRRFGDVDGVRREMGKARGHREGPSTIHLLTAFSAQVRYAWRGLANNVVFTAAVVTTLALGVGAATSVFSVLDALLLRPMPYREAGRLIEVNKGHKDDAYTFGLPIELANGWKDAAAEFTDGWLEYSRTSLVRTDGPVTEELNVLAVTPAVDTLLGIPLLMGRSFTPADAVPGADEVAVITAGYFRRLGADPGILGSTLQLESGPVTVVGVLRGGIKFPQILTQPDLWVALRDDHTLLDRPAESLDGVWARLRPGIELGPAQARADVLASSLQEENPQPRGWQVRLMPVGSHRANGDMKRAIWALTATVGAIFLIALVNGVNLLLVRTAARLRELAIRTAIGGSRSRILGQFLVEGLVLGALGGVAAAGLAALTIPAIGRIVPRQVLLFSPHALEMESRTVLFAFTASLVAGLLLGLLPSIQILRHRALHVTLAGRGTHQTRGRRWIRSGLVMGQAALSTTLLVVAGLFVRSYATLATVDPGFDHQTIAMADITFSPTRYSEAADRAEFVRRLGAALDASPYTDGVTTTNGSGITFGVELLAEGLPAPASQPTMVPFTTVATNYTTVMGVVMASGRGFLPTDVDTDAAVVDLDLARLLWGQADPVGRRFRVWESQPWYTVVGVAEELRLLGRDQRSGPYQILFPASPDEQDRHVEFAVRTTGDPARILGFVRSAVLDLDPAQPIDALRTASAALAEEEGTPRFTVALFTLLALIALALSGVGLYGVLANSVAQRERELGIRLALGAMPRKLRRSVVANGVTIAGVGLMLGLAGAMVASGTVEPLLYEVAPRDPVTLLGTAVFFMLVAVAASLMPARRATRGDPVEVLRND